MKKLWRRLFPVEEHTALQRVVRHLQNGNEVAALGALCFTIDERIEKELRTLNSYEKDHQAVR